MPPIYCPVSAEIICGPRRPRAKQSNLTAIWMEADSRVDTCQQQHVQGHQLFIFKQANLRTVSWIEEKDGFVKTLEKQAIIIEELNKKGEELINNEHFDAVKIKEMVEAAKTRMEAVRDKCVQRLRKLEESRQRYNGIYTRKHGWKGLPKVGGLRGGADENEKKEKDKKKEKEKETAQEKDKEKLESEHDAGRWLGLSPKPPNLAFNPVGSAVLQPVRSNREEIDNMLSEIQEVERRMKEQEQEELKKIKQEIEELRQELNQQREIAERQDQKQLMKAQKEREKAEKEKRGWAILEQALMQPPCRPGYVSLKEPGAIEETRKPDAAVAREERVRAEEDERRRVEEEKRAMEEAERKRLEEEERKRLEEEERRAKEEKQRLRMEEMEKEAEIAAEAEERSRQEEETRLKKKKTTTIMKISKKGTGSARRRG